MARETSRTASLGADRRVDQVSRWVLVILATVLPLLLGLVLMFWQAEQSLQAEAAAADQFAQAQIEAMLDSASLAARAVAPLIGSSCSEAERALRVQATSRPFVRSVNLVDNGIIYCASLEGSVDTPEEVEAYADGRLRLMAGNDLTPDRAVLIYRQPVGTGSVLVGIDGQHLINLLQRIGEETDIALGVGDNWMLSDGTVQDVAPGPMPVAHSQAHSERYPFQLQAGYPAGAQWQFINRHYLPLLVLLGALGIAAGFGVYRITLQSQSPRAEFERAMAAGEFVPYYQPYVRGDNGQWGGVEMLMRWHHPVEGMIPPNNFVPYAERSGLIVPITERLMRQVRTDLSGLLATLPPHFHVSINISAAHFTSLRLIEQCRQFLAAFPADRIALTLELTERELIESTEITDQLFDGLRLLGVEVAIDDFGTGHSSLSYLQKFRINTLKIDRAFVASVGSDASSLHILDNIIDLAQRLNLAIVAEGVETDAQRDYLVQRGVQFLQGYLFARPMPIKVLKAVLAHEPGITLPQEMPQPARRRARQHGH